MYRIILEIITRQTLFIDGVVFFSQLSVCHVTFKLDRKTTGR